MDGVVLATLANMALRPQVISAGNSLIGPIDPPMTLLMQTFTYYGNGNAVGVNPPDTNSAGTLVVPFPTQFPNGIVSCFGQMVNTSNIMCTVEKTSMNVAQFAFDLFFANTGGPLSNFWFSEDAVAISVLAFGW